MENNEIKRMLNQIEPITDLKDKLLSIKDKNEKQHATKIINLKKIVNIAATFVMVLGVGVGTVYAAEHIWGLNLFMKELPNEATPYINTNISSDAKENIDILEDLVRVKPVETIFEGKSCFIALEVTLTDESDYIILPSDYSMTQDCTFENALESEKIGEYAKRTNKKVIKANATSDDSLNYGASRDSKLISENQLMLYLELTSQHPFEEGTTIDIHFYADVYEVDDDSVFVIGKDETIGITVDNVAKESASRYYALSDQQPMSVEDSGIVIQSIAVTNTILETKVDFVFENCDVQRISQLSVNIVNDDGSFYQNGYSSSGNISVLDNGKIITCVAYKKMDFPECVNVRIKDLITGKVYYLKGIPCVR
ncbi:MAG: hypothetical protein ACI4AQ_06485 [Lachnospiraceae bacterium]